jgi:hypothetical protein
VDAQLIVAVSPELRADSSSLFSLGQESVFAVVPSRMFIVYASTLESGTGVDSGQSNLRAMRWLIKVKRCTVMTEAATSN